LRWRHSRSLLQALVLAAALLMLWDGFWGPQLAPKNVAAVTAWVHYRGFLVLALLLVGNLFCFACPFMLPRRLGKWLQGRVLPGPRPLPRFLRTKWFATLLLFAFFFAYERWDLWASPWLTAWLILGYFLAAFVVDLIFPAATFCKAVCPVGQFNFFGSLISPTEIKVRDPDICMRCTTKDCIRGQALAASAVSEENRRRPARPRGSTPIALVDGIQAGCELHLFQPRKVGNADCTFCLDCVHACPYDNVGWLARVPTRELWHDPWRSGIGRFSQRYDLLALLTILVFGGFMNAFGMIRPVYDVLRWIVGLPGLGSSTVAIFLLFAAGLIVIPVILFGLAGLLSRAWSATTRPLREVIACYVPALVPVGFGMWLAHYNFHFLTGGLTIVPVLQSFLQRVGLPVGEPAWHLGPLVWPDVLFPLEVVLLYLGLTGSLVVAWQIARREHPAMTVAVKAFLPWALLCALLVAAGIWILAQPMEMRGTLNMLVPR
jgi:ferredoxin